MTGSDADGRLHWYQRSWLWVVVALAALPLAFAIVILRAVFDVNNVVFGVLGSTISGFGAGGPVDGRSREPTRLGTWDSFDFHHPSPRLGGVGRMELSPRVGG